MKFLFNLFLFISLVLLGGIKSVLASLDPYEMMESLLPRNQQPRILNVIDTPVPANVPIPLFSPEGDFNSDGTEDLAISGIYGFPEKGNTYFLLVGTRNPRNNKFVRLYFEEFKIPAYLYKKGTTGEADPGNQSFSLSFCFDCSEGWDYFWDKKQKSFTKKIWDKKIRRQNPVSVALDVDVSSSTLDKALQIVGKLSDVVTFVKQVEKRGNKLVTRAKQSGPEDFVIEVSIFERSKNKDIFYDSISVNTNEETIVKRTKKFKLKKN
jgi:hypothetical protein